MSVLVDKIIIWNNMFPYDRVYRKKYNIAFGSEEHRKLNQIDIYLDFLEDKVFEDYAIEFKREEDNKKHYQKTGEWLSFNEFEKDKLDELFEAISIEKMQQQQKEKDG